MGALTWLAARPKSVASTAVLSLAAGAVVVLAVTSDGFSATRLDLNDGGVWVTKPLQLGRLNAQLQQLDTTLVPEASAFDVLQDGSDVWLIDQEKDVVQAVDVAKVDFTSRLELTKGFVVSQAGGGAVVLDTVTGRAWVRPVPEMLGLDREKDEPTLEAGKGAAATVGRDGTVHVLSTARDEVISVALGPDGPGEPQVTALGFDVRQGAITAVGATAVVLDATARRVILPDVGAVGLGSGATHPVLQQPGDAAGAAIVAVDRAVLAVPLDGGDVRTVVTTPAESPTAPLWVAGCMHAAWNQQPTYAYQCAGGPPEVKDITGLGAKADLRLRTNWGQVVLNDLESGNLWLFDAGLIDIQENWDQVRPESEGDGDEQSDSAGSDAIQTKPDPTGRNRPPKALDDTYGARPSRASVLPVLNNDKDPDGDVLVVSEVPKSVRDGRLDRIDGGRRLQFTPEPGTSGRTVTFSYTVDDGRGGRDEATVMIAIRGESQNSPPEPIPGQISETVVEAGQTVTYNVLVDWQDPDGDPLQLTDARSSVPGDTVRFNADGRVTFVANSQPGKHKVQLAVSDGTKSAEGLLNVGVRAAGELDPKARPDYYVATVGERLVLRPLLNDSDPNGDEITIRTANLIGTGATILPNLDKGEIRFESDRAGTHRVLYDIGSREPVRGVIRIDVLAPEGNHPPIAVLDTVSLNPSLTSLVDVVANDYDPDGDVLVLQSADVPADVPVTVAVIQHRALEVHAQRVPQRPITVTYTVSDGRTAVEGSLVVRPPVFRNGRNQPPVALDDTAVVRVGDVVTVNVLANDSDADGDPLTLMPDLSGGDRLGGAAFVSDRSVRFLAGDRAGTVKLAYTVTDGRDRASGRVTIRVRERNAQANKPPQPLPLVARVIAGSEKGVRIRVPLDGIDPDGDAVTLVGPDISATPRFAAKPVQIAPNARDVLVYVPRRDAAGTDTFAYRVTDRFGASATALVRVGIAPPSRRNHDPVAADDKVTALPGRTVDVDVLANDSDPDGDAIAFITTEPLTPLKGAQARLRGDRIVVTVPKDGETVQVLYTVEDGHGGRATGTLAVTGSTSIGNLPPVARDDRVAEAEPGRTDVQVDVLNNDYDQDGEKASLRVSGFLPESAGATATINPDGTITAQLTAAPRAFVYQISDGEDTAAAVVWLPAMVVLPPPGEPPAPDAPNQPPRATGGGLEIASLADKPVSGSFSIAEFAVDPEGQPIRLATNSSVRGDALVTARPGGPASVAYTVGPKAAGSGTITFEVIDTPSLQTQNSARATISIPVVVTAPEEANRPPTVRDGTLDVAAGESPATLDVAVLAQDPDPADRLTVTVAAPPEGPVDITVDGSVVTASAGPEVPKGTTATVAFRAEDDKGAAATGEVRIRVTATSKPLPSAADISVDGRAGEAVSVDVAPHVSNPFPDKPFSILTPSVLEGAAGVSGAGTTVTITPSADAGAQRVTVSYRVQDATGDPAREAEGRIYVTVTARPDKPAAPTEAGKAPGEVTLTWPSPNSNGSPITSYVLSWSGGSKDCGTATTCTVSGLRNGSEYRFTVTARNAVGDSDPSDPSVGITPDVAPSNPPTPTVVRPDTTAGRVLDVSWGAFTNEDGSDITGCELSFGGSVQSVSCAGRDGSGSIKINGLTNGQPYSFKVRATNDAGTSDWSEGSDPGLGKPAGHPSEPGTPTVTTAGGPVGGQLAVSWSPPADDRGAQVTGYLLEGAGGTQQVNGTSATVDGLENGRAYRFRVIAVTEVGQSGPSGWSADESPFGQPKPVTGLTAKPADQSIIVTFGEADGNGRPIQGYEAQVGGGGAQSIGAGGGTISGLSNGTSYTVQVRGCNVEYCGEWVTSNAVIPFGLPGQPQVSASASGSTVTLSWSAPAPNGRDVVAVDVSVNGGGWTRESPNGSKQVNVGFGATGTIRARAVDSEGQAGPEASASATTPNPAASVWKGAPKQVPGVCTDPSCAWVMASVSNFPPNRSFTGTLSGGGASGYWNFTINTDGNGNWSGSTGSVFGFPGSSVSLSVNVDGTTVSATSAPW